MLKAWKIIGKVSTFRFVMFWDQNTQDHSDGCKFSSGRWFQGDHHQRQTQRS